MHGDTPSKLARLAHTLTKNLDTCTKVPGGGKRPYAIKQRHRLARNTQNDFVVAEASAHVALGNTKQAQGSKPAQQTKQKNKSAARPNRSEHQTSSGASPSISSFSSAKRSSMACSSDSSLWLTAFGAIFTCCRRRRGKRSFPCHVAASDE